MMLLRVAALYAEVKRYNFWRQRIVSRFPQAMKVK
jgi:hypothetical protein